MMSDALNCVLRSISNGASSVEQIDARTGQTIIEHCRSRVSHWQEQIHCKVSDGAMRVARREMMQMIRSLPARLVAADKAYSCHLRKIARRAGQKEHGRFRETWLLAERLRTHAGPSKPEVYRKRKSSGGYRKVFRFNQLDQARNHLLALAIQPFASFHLSQFTLRRGRSAACEALLQRLNEPSGEFSFAQIDIVDFYGSISHEWLEENMPCSHASTRNILHTGGMLLRTKGKGNARLTDEDRVEAGRRGIPAGSAASPLIAEWVMGDVLKGLADHLQSVTLITYSDNVGAVVPLSLEKHVFEELVRKAFNNHAAGPFQIKCSIASDDKAIFRFLGYDWRRADGKYIAEVREQVWSDRLCSWMGDAALASLGDLENIERRVRGYCSAFKLWPKASKLQEVALEGINNCRLSLFDESIRNANEATRSSLMRQRREFELRRINAAAARVEASGASDAFWQEDGLGP